MIQDKSSTAAKQASRPPDAATDSNGHRRWSNYETEQYLLAAIFLSDSQESRAESLTRLWPDVFVFEDNRALFCALALMEKRGSAFDVPHLQQALEEIGKYECVASSPAYGAIINGSVRDSNLDRYIAELVEFWRRREAAVEMKRARQELLIGQSRARDVQARLSVRLDSIRLKGEKATAEAEPKPKFQFRTAAEIAAEGSPVVEWVAKPWIARGALTEIDGKVKVAGKTTFATHICRQVLDGGDFCGEPTEKTPVVYLTEQPRATFNESMRRAGLLEREDFYVLFWHECRGRSWPEIVEAAVAKCLEVGAGLLIVDTVSQFAGLDGDAENDAGSALKACQPLQWAAAEHNIGVGLLRHERKAGGDVGDSGRGSSAWAGAADVVLSLRRGEGNTRPTVRVIKSLSRFDETPETLLVELRDGSYRALGSETAVAAAEARKAILDRLPTSQSAALTLSDLQEAIKQKRTLIQEEILGLLSAGAVAKVGAGKRGDPFRYYRAGEGEKVSAAYTDVVPAESISNDPQGASLPPKKVSAGTPVVPAESISTSSEGVKKVSAATSFLNTAESFSGGKQVLTEGELAVLASRGVKIVTIHTNQG
jgi:AAA domain/DnaB-like helicase N terminal domain